MGAISKDKINEMIKLYHEGHGLREISSLIEVSYSSVYRILSKEIGFEQFNPELSDDETNKIIELCEKGYSSTKIKDILGISYKRIARCIALNTNWYSYKVGRDLDRIDKRRDEFLNDYLTSTSLKSITTKYNIEHNTYMIAVRRYVNKNDMIEERLRKYLPKKDYFNELNDSKAYIIGIIFSVAVAFDGRFNQVIKLSAPRECKESFEIVHDELYDGKKPNIYLPEKGQMQSRIPGRYISKELVDLGLFGDISIPDRFKHSFVDGFIFKALEVKKDYIGFKFKKSSYEKFFNKYFKDFLGIKKLNCTKTSYIIKDKEDINKLCKYHPIVRDKILDSGIERFINIVGDEGNGEG